MTAQIPIDIAKKVVSPRTYGEAGQAYDALAWLRANMPVGRAELPHYDPFWIITKYDDIRAVSRDNARFRSGDRPTVLTSLPVEQMLRKAGDGSPHLVRSLVQMDAPDHPKFRRLTQAWFSPGQLKKLEDRVRVIAREHIQAMKKLGSECDFAHDVAFHYPLHVVMDLMGVPREDEPLMLRLTQELFGAADSEANRKKSNIASPQDAYVALTEIVEEFSAYYDAIARDRLQSPQEDIATIIAHAKIYDAPISRHDAVSYFMIVATAGHDTTSSTLASSMMAMAQYPDQFDKLKADPALIPQFIEEAIRWTSPIKHFMRTAAEDCTLGDQDIRAGEQLFLSYPSGNRDTAIFEDPDAFRIDRHPNPHVAFGFGGHICLGRYLGRMEMAIFWEELLADLSGVELAGAPAFLVSNFVSGPTRLPVRLSLNSGAAVC